MIRLCLVDSDPFAAAGLWEFLAGIPDFEVEEVLGSGQEALALPKPPEVLIVGFLPEQTQGSFVETLAARHWPVRILVKGETEQIEEVLALLKAGAHGYFLRGDSKENMEAAIRAVIRREPWFSPKIAMHLLARLDAEEEEEEEEGQLTVREREVLQMVEKGMSNQMIALLLNRRLRTVKAHLEHIFRKLGVNNRMTACLVAREKGWL